MEACPLDQGMSFSPGRSLKNIGTSIIKATAIDKDEMAIVNPNKFINEVPITSDKAVPIVLAGLLTGFLTVSSSFGAYQLVDTGQDTCWDDMGDVVTPQPGQEWYGQDAQFTGVQMGFTDNGDGTITDNNTIQALLSSIDEYSGD